MIIRIQQNYTIVETVEVFREKMSPTIVVQLMRTRAGIKFSARNTRSHSTGAVRLSHVGSTWIMRVQVGDSTPVKCKGNLRGLGRCTLKNSVPDAFASANAGNAGRFPRVEVRPLRSSVIPSSVMSYESHYWHTPIPMLHHSQ